MTMARGAYNPHSRFLNIIYSMFDNKDVPTPEELNPYCFNAGRPEKSETEIFMDFKNIVDQADSHFSKRMYIHPSQLK